MTINLGLRYEFIPPWTDSSQRQIVADIPLNTQQPQVPDKSLHPVLVRAGTGDFYQDANIRYSPDIQVARDGRFGERPIKAEYTNFAPRLGVAWSPTERWAVRAGAGRFFVQDIGNIVFDKNRNLQRPAHGAIHGHQPDFDLAGSVQFRRSESLQYACGHPVRGETAGADRPDRSQNAVRRSIGSDRRTAAQRATWRSR